MKPPKNFYSNLDRRKQGLPELPEATSSDAGKVLKVGEDGAYELGADENTIIIPNPETSPSATLNTLTIGNTTYKVNEARVTKVLGLRFTIDNGGIYVTKMPIVSFVNEYGEAAQVPSYAMTCDKPLQYGSLYLNGDAGITTENLPAIFNVLFNAEFNIEDFANIKLENSELFPQDIAKNIKLEYSVNGTDWVEIFDKVSIDWTNTIHIYDMSTGEEITTKSPIPEPTVADAGKFLGVDNNGVWELDNVPSELPTVTSADEGKVLGVNSSGEWNVTKIPSPVIRVEVSNITYNSNTDTYSGNLAWKDSSGNPIAFEDIGSYKLILISLFNGEWDGQVQTCMGISVLRTLSQYIMGADFQTLFIANSTGYRFTTKSVSFNSALSTIIFKVVPIT